MTPLRPSRVLRGVLRRLLPSAREDALGDLDEELARGHPGWRGELWYARESASLVAALVAERLVELRTTMRGGLGMSGLRGDLWRALRGLAREPLTTLVVGATLAIAIGATTTIVAVADAAFLRPFPYPSADRLVRLYSGSREDPEATMAISPLDVRDLGAYGAVVEAIGAWSLGETVHLTDADEPRRLEAPRASASLFGILGVEPELGRFFTPEEEVPGGDDAVVLSHALWVSAFGANPTIVGTTVALDDRRYRVVGVAPAAGMLPRGADAWRPLALGPEWYEAGRWGWQFLAGVARLRPGVSPEGLGPVLTARLAESVPQRVERGQTRVARTLQEERVGGSGPALLLLLGAVGLLLAMACANVVNVILARSEHRTREFGLRRALGASAGPLVRVVAGETAALAAVGGVGGIVLARLALRLLGSADIGSVAYLGALTVDGRVAAAALAVTAGAAGVVGLAPAVFALRASPRSVLHGNDARSGTTRGARKLRSTLVITQVTMACTLLVAVGVSARAFSRLVGRDPGFRPEGVLAASLELPAGIDESVAGPAFYRGLLDRIGAIPGARAAGAVQYLPLSGVGWSASFDVIDPDPGMTDPDPGGNMRATSPGYFEAMGIPLVEGRAFLDSDGPGAPPVVIVDETIARRYWPAGSPVGRLARVGALSAEPATVVGVVGSVSDVSLAAAGNGHVYFPLYQRSMRAMSLVVRTEGDPASLAPAVRAAVREADARIPVTEIVPLREHVRESVAAPRVGLLLLALFGGAAASLAAVGIYGVVAYDVSRARRELGTRIALGAEPAGVLGRVVGRAMRLWTAGALLGALGGFGAAEALARFIQGASVAEPLPYVGAILGLGVIALVAALGPAARATAIDPARALRSD